MTQSEAEIQNPREERLPRFDWILLPLISLVTVASMLGLAEVGALVAFPEDKKDVCLVQDPRVHFRFLPNCHSRTKLAEGKWVDNSYNECGYPSQESCGTKPAGSIRIAVLGSSSSFGYGVRYDQGYTTLASKSLSKQCGRKVEFQNLGVPGASLIDIYHRTGEALALKPDLLMLVVDPIDVNVDISRDVIDRRNEQSVATANSNVTKAPSWMKRHVVLALHKSRAVFIIQHFMFQNPHTYSSLYLLYGDNADYLRPPFTAKWRQRFDNLDVLLGDISSRADSEGVPMLLMVGLSAAQVALIDDHSSRQPQIYAFSEEVRKIGQKHGIGVMCSLPSFANRPDPMGMFYVADGHFSPRGEQIIAEALDKSFLSSGIPAFAGCMK